VRVGGVAVIAWALMYCKVEQRGGVQCQREKQGSFDFSEKLGSMQLRHGKALKMTISFPFASATSYKRAGTPMKITSPYCAMI